MHPMSGSTLADSARVYALADAHSLVVILLGVLSAAHDAESKAAIASFNLARRSRAVAV